MKKLKNKRAITLIALIITIAIMLILVGVTVSTTLGGNGLIEKTKKQAFIYEITEIQEQTELLKGKEDISQYRFGTLEQILGIDGENKYNEMLCIENGELVYIADKVTEKQAEWLQEEGITVRQNIIPIYTVAQFEKIASGETVEIDGIEYTFNANSTYYLQNDIDFGGSAESPNSPITTAFAGILDGQGYIIRNVYMAGSGNKGMFSSNSGKILNLKITDSYIKSTSQSYVGVICCENYGTIKNIELCDIDNGSIEPERSGGMTGSNYGLIENCCSENVNGPTIAGTNYSGGKVLNCYNKEYSTSKGVHLINGNSAGGIIENCYNLASTTANSYLVGIVGSNSGIVIRCSNYGNIGVGGTPYESNGVCRFNNETGVIMNSFNGGKTFSRYGSSGGIVGNNYGKIIGCYNSGDITARDSKGGICFNNTGTIISSYNVGDASNCWFVPTNTGTIIGCYDKTSRSALVSSNTGTITNSYYYDSTNKVMCDAEGTAITINEGETEATALKRLLQVANDSLSTDEDYATKKVTWRVDASRNEGYPCFDWETD